jgi:hypothetical protein
MPVRQTWDSETIYTIFLTGSFALPRFMQNGHRGVKLVKVRCQIPESCMNKTIKNHVKFSKSSPHQPFRCGFPIFISSLLDFAIFFHLPSSFGSFYITISILFLSSIDAAFDFHFAGHECFCELI